MTTIILWILAGYVFTFVCWILYLAVMSLSAHRKEMGVVVKAHALILLLVAYPLDLVLNVVVGSVLFLSPPKEFTLTARLKRHQKEGGWRGKVASWICKNLLNAFDPDGHHC